MKTILTYDATYEGFLSCVFYAYEHNLLTAHISKQTIAEHNFFDTFIYVSSEEEKADRVHKKLIERASPTGASLLFKAFLSELSDIENCLFYCVKQLLHPRFHKTPEKAKNILKNYADPTILRIAKVVKMVGREKHRMDAFVRFKLTKDNIYFATIAPDFNVLPLNRKHFENRYADQKWLIYDVHRNYGIYYDLQKVSTVEMQMNDKLLSMSADAFYFTQEELQYEELWRNYFQSTTIKSRKNTKLHVQHVPKRYWKYLSEKSPISKF